MDSFNTEQKAVNKVRELFEDSNRLTAFISDADKVPVWDGEIQLSLLGNTKRGRVPVQVKGKNSDVAQSYSIKTSYLESYKKDGGVVYFVVFLFEKKKYPYWALLTPIAIKRYLNQAADQETISVRLSAVPEDLEQIEEQIYDFYYDCKRQASFADKPILPLEQALKDGRKLQVFVRGCHSKQEAINKVFVGSHYFYTELGEGNFTCHFPVGDQTYCLLRKNNVNIDINAGGKIFFNHYEVFKKDNYFHVNIGNYLYLRIKQDNEASYFESAKIRSSSHGLKTHLNEIAFLKAIVENESFSIGSDVVPIPSPSQADITIIKEEYQNWSKAYQLFSLLKVEDDIDMESLSAEDEENLLWMIRALVDGEDVTFEHQLNSFITPSIGRYTFLLAALPKEGTTYSICDAFSIKDEFVFGYESEDKKNKLISSYFSVVFTHPHFNLIANIDYSKMIPSYEWASQFNPAICDKATLDLITALLVYDQDSVKDPNLLQALSDLADWIIKKAPIKHTFYTINRLQIIKRSRVLSEEEKDLLYSFTQNADEGNMVMVACHLLLDNNDLAKRYFKKLTHADQRLFKSWPISCFMNKDN